MLSLYMPDEFSGVTQPIVQLLTVPSYGTAGRAACPTPSAVKRWWQQQKEKEEGEVRGASLTAAHRWNKVFLY